MESLINEFIRWSARRSQICNLAGKGFGTFGSACWRKAVQRRDAGRLVRSEY